MDTKAAFDISAVALNIPLWSLVTGASALVSFGIGLGWLGFNVRESIKSNIVQNNLNHETQMQALDQQNDLLQQIVCLSKEHLYSIGKPNYRYEGHCENKRG